MWCRGTGVTNHTHPSFDLLYPRSDNCKVGLYCDTNSTVCIQQKAFAASCSADKECSSYNCLPDQTCGGSPSNPRHFPMWVYIIIGVGIFGGEHDSLFVLAYYNVNFFFSPRYDCNPNRLVHLPRPPARG